MENIYLTFDDGPLEPYTRELLDLLQSYDAHATFFVCGKSALRYPHLVKRMHDDGHTIGNHTYSHSFLKTVSGALGKEIEKTSAILEGITGARPILFRPPWGILRPRTKAYAKAHGYHTVLWDSAGYDWHSPSPSYIGGRIIKKIRPGTIVLLHDGNEAKDRGVRKNTVAATKLLLEYCKQNGYTAERLPER